MTTSYLKCRQESLSRSQNVSQHFQKNVAGLTPAAFSGGGPGSAGVFKNDNSRQKQIQSYEQFKSWVYVCSSYIAKRFATQPILAGEKLGASANPERGLDGRWATKSGNPIRRYKDLLPSIQQKNPLADVEVFSSHAALDAMCRPNYLQGTFQFRYMSAINVLLTGESYWLLSTEKDKDTGEEHLELWAVPTHWIQPDHRKGPYTAFRFKPPGMAGEGIPLDPECVCRTYFTNPATMTGVWSPLHAILKAAKIDDHIMYSQEQMFARGINPNLILTIAQRRGPDGKPTGARPTLTGAQRRQMIRSVREVWGNTLNFGDPAIIDGLIEGVHKLQSTPSEMDWLNSDASNKARIMQAFGVNPIVVGEVVGSNRAQAVAADRAVSDNTINPLIDMFSATMTECIGPLFDEPERLLLWVEKCEPVDPEIRDKRWLMGHKQGIINDDEIRGELYGLTAKQEEVTGNTLLNSHTGMQMTLMVIQTMNNDGIDREAAVQFLMLFLDVEEPVADALVGPKIEQEEATSSAIAIQADMAASQAKAKEETKKMLDGVLDEVAAVKESGEDLGGRMVEFAQGVMRSLSEFGEDSQKRIEEATKQPSFIAAPPKDDSTPIYVELVRSFQDQIGKMIEKSAEPPVIEVNLPPPVVNVSCDVPEVVVNPQIHVDATEVVVNPQIQVDIPEIAQPRVEVVSLSPIERVSVIQHDDGTKSTLTSKPLDADGR